MLLFQKYSFCQNPIGSTQFKKLYSFTIFLSQHLFQRKHWVLQLWLPPWLLKSCCAPPGNLSPDSIAPGVRSGRTPSVWAAVQISQVQRNGGRDQWISSRFILLGCRWRQRWPDRQKLKLKKARSSRKCHFIFYGSLLKGREPDSPTALSSLKMPPCPRQPSSLGRDPSPVQIVHLHALSEGPALLSTASQCLWFIFALSPCYFKIV